MHVSFRRNFSFWNLPAREHYDSPNVYREFGGQVLSVAEWCQRGPQMVRIVSASEP